MPSDRPAAMQKTPIQMNGTPKHSAIAILLAPLANIPIAPMTIRHRLGTNHRPFTLFTAPSAPNSRSQALLNRFRDW